MKKKISSPADRVGEFKLPEKERNALAEIFTEAMIPAVEKACARYLHEDGKGKTPAPEDGKRLLDIGEKARELRQLLKDSKSKPALARVHLHVSEEYGKHDVLSFIEDLKEKLRKLEGMTFDNPASDWAMNPRRGKPGGALNQGARTQANRALAFQLWEIYRQAHGRPAARIVNREDGTEEGPLPRAAAILKPILGFKDGFVRGNLSRYFREIGEDFMDNKYKMDET